MSETAAESGDQQAAEGSPAKPDARPSQPTTAAELERSIRLIRIAIAIGVVLIATMTLVFVAFLGAPAVPLIPLAGLVVIVDLIMLVAFTRQRRRALADLRAEDGQVPSG